MKGPRQSGLLDARSASLQVVLPRRRTSPNQWPNPRHRLALQASILLGVAAWWLGLSESFVSRAACGDERPNILVVLSDDLGYGDLACYGHPVIKTPNLDRFASEGMKFTSCYSAAPNCSPARTGLMTGRTPYRVGIHNWIAYESPMHVPSEELTIATRLRRAGYTTCHVGKWHLNGRFNDVAQPQPADHGFDHWFSTQNNALPSHRNPDNFVRNGRPVGALEGFSAGLVADEAIRWLGELRDRSRPFFLYVCFHEPHEPIETDERFSRLYDAPDESTLPAHHGNVTQMDEAFGRLIGAVDRLGLRDDTLVFFTSDNGPAITNQHPHGSAGPLRDKKGSLYEGGIRVPGMLRWPGKTRAGETSDEPICGVDLLPTLCEVAGIPKPTDRTLDGASFLPALEGRPIERPTPLYWQFHMAHNEPKVAMRIGGWKLLATLDRPSPAPTGGITEEHALSIKQSKLGTFELYNLADDIGETTDLAEKQPERLAEMKAAMSKMFAEVQRDSRTWPAWEWPRYEGQRIRAYQEQRRRERESNGAEPKTK